MPHKTLTKKCEKLPPLGHGGPEVKFSYFHLNYIEKLQKSRTLTPLTVEN